MKHNLRPAPKHRKGTLTFYQHAVERTILAMRARLSEPLNLETCAAIAIMSPYHFLRVFEEVTCISPARFLAALRIERAKELLLRTDLSVTDICYEVGYTSLGTFTRIFTEFVGLSPNRLRNFTSCYNFNIQEREQTSVGIGIANGSDLSSVEGAIYGPRDFAGMIFVGLFRTRIPQGRPTAGTLIEKLGSYNIQHVPNGMYYHLAAAFPASSEPLDYIMPQQSRLLVANGLTPTSVINGRTKEKTTLTLRRLMSTDPPILITLPLLLIEQLNGRHTARP
jgi:AraC family transcriptional regulator